MVPSSHLRCCKTWSGCWDVPAGYEHFRACTLKKLTQLSSPQKLRYLLFLMDGRRVCCSICFLHSSVFVSGPKPLDCLLNSLLSTLLHVFKWKRCTWYIVYSTLDPSTTYISLIAATYHLNFRTIPLWPVSTIFLLCFCRHWYFTSLGAIAWPRRFSETLCRWTPRPTRSGTAWVRCCRLKAMMMPPLNASWRHWSLKPAVLLSLLRSSREFFERISWPTYFGLTSGCGNPVFQAAW